MFKHNFQYEDYLNTLPHTSANLFMKFRLLNHKLPVQKVVFWESKETKGCVKNVISMK